MRIWWWAWPTYRSIRNRSVGVIAPAGARSAAAVPSAATSSRDPAREAGLAASFKLIEAAERGWRRVNAPELVALVRGGAKFVNGRLVERADKEDVA